MLLLTNLLQQIRLEIATSRPIHTGNIWCGQGRVMSKIMNTAQKNKKHRYTDVTPMQSPSSFSKGAHEGKKSGSSRRVAVLNKLFMRHITELMASGQYSQQFVGHGIEINRVKVTPDFHSVNVYWIGRGLESDKTIDTILQTHSGHLRHELSQLRVMGVVPKIHFIKDKQFAQLMEIDSRLSNADFGDEYIPEDPATKLKSQLQLQTKLDPNIKQAICKLDDDIPLEEDDEDIPPMPHNVLGLNHADIMERVLKSINKSEARHRLQEDKMVSDLENPRQVSTNEDPVRFTSMRAQREAFREFLSNRQLMKMKANKQPKNERTNPDDFNNDWMIKQQMYRNELEFNEFLEDTDFIDEDENK